MKFTVKQRVFSFGAKYDVWDIEGNPVYHVCGEVFSLGRVLHILDMNDNEVASVEQRIFTFGPKYDVYCGSELRATISKQLFTFIGSHYTIEGTDWEVEGAPLSHEFSIVDGSGNEVAQISKEWFTWGDAYQISIAEHVDAVTALAVVLVIDACIDAQRD